MGFLGSSAGKDSAYNARDPGSTPRLGTSPGEGIVYPLQNSWTSLVAQTVKNPPAMRETWVPSLGLADPLWQPTPVFLTGESPWTEGPGGLSTAQRGEVLFPRSHSSAGKESYLKLILSSSVLSLLYFFSLPP